MAEAFIGLGVHVELSNGSSLEGTVSHIDPHTQLLTLKNVKLDNKNTGCIQQLAIYGVPGTDIKDLQILSNQQSTFQQKPPEQPSQNNVKNAEDAKSYSKSNTPVLKNISAHEITQNRVLPTALLPNSPFTDPAIISYSHGPSTSQHQSISPASSYDLERTSPSHVQLHYQQIVQGPHTPPKTIQSGSTGDSDSKYEEEIQSNTGKYEKNSKNAPNVNNHHEGDSTGAESDNAVFKRNTSRRKKNNGTNGYYQNHRIPQSPARRPRRGRRQMHEWAGGDVNDFKSEEFDFQGNLDLFDKEKVFAEIRVGNMQTNKFFC